MAANDKTLASTERPTGGEATDSERNEDESTEADETDETVPELPLDQVFEILKNRRRRTVLQYLEGEDEPVPLGEIAEHVAADENDTTVAKVTSKERKCAYVGLYQCHLPKMDDMNIVEFNQNRGHVRLGPNAGQLKQYLDWEAQDRRPWPLLYGAVSGTGFGLVALTAVFTGTGIAPLVVSMLVLVAISVISIVGLQSESDSSWRDHRRVPFRHPVDRLEQMWSK
jgi:hypothetical protein